MSNFKFPVYAWYFPNWHPDPRNDEWHGKGWTEWEVSKRATPRFPGHQQPRIPLWGYEDESDPAVMAKKIDASLKHGIDGFLWDFYWFEDGGYRLGALDQGFFGAENNEQFKIALMWCNHDPIYVHPASRLYRRPSLLPGELSPQAFRNGTEYMIKNYFWRKNYIRIEGKIYFVIWDLPKLIAGFGGMEGARMVLDDFRSRVREAGLGEVFLATQVGSVRGHFEGDKEKIHDFVHGLGIDGLLTYSWPHVPDAFPAMEYEQFRDGGIAQYASNAQMTDLPTNITVSSGWDSSPRTVQSEIYENIGYPFTAVTVNATPEAYEVGLRAARDFALSDGFTGHFITLSTFNEWTEGNFLEPDELYGYGFMEAVQRVFG